MSVITPLLQFIGSLGFLLYGMKLMSNGIQNSAGEKLQRALSVVTKNRFVGLLTGLLITMIIQSSGATTVMVTTFVNAGLLTTIYWCYFWCKYRYDNYRVDCLDFWF